MAEEEGSKVCQEKKKKKENCSVCLVLLQFLPTYIRPIHYDLTITPDLEKRKFYGEVFIQFEVKKPTKQIKMHQKFLEVSFAEGTRQKKTKQLQQMGKKFLFRFELSISEQESWFKCVINDRSER
jgi:aminopeptidase N